MTGGVGYLDDMIDPVRTRDPLVRSLAVARGRRGAGIGEHRLAVWPASF